MKRCAGCEREMDAYPCPHCGFDPAAYQPPAYALRCNSILHGRYLVGKVLGQGGFGITYVGWDLALQVKCAIKEYYPSGQVTRAASGTTLNWYSTPQAQTLRLSGMDSFLKEARKMARAATIPQVVSVRDTFVENETAYIVMDYVEGRTLKERLEQEGILSWEEAMRIFFPVIAAMEQVHTAGLVHRDLSPDNLMLLPDGDVKILDLGAAKDLTVNQGLSSMQVVKGGFSPIEQYGQAGSSGPWTDVYAMAATMYYALTGKLPPVAVDRLTEDTLSWDLPQLQVLPKRVPEALKQAMAVLAKDRTQSMGELLAQMEARSRRRPQPKQAGSSPVKTGNPGKNRRFTAIAAGALALALAGGIFVWASAPEDAQPVTSQKEPTVIATLPPETEVPVSMTSEPTQPPRAETFPATPQAPVKNSVSCGGAGNYWAAVGITPDGKLRMSSYVSDFYSDAEHWLDDMVDWENIASLSCGPLWAAGLKTDGTVILAPKSAKRFREGMAEYIATWHNIVQVSAGEFGVLGLRPDGTVLAAGIKEQTRLEIEAWTDIAAVCTGSDFAAGLKTDGTVVTTGYVGETADWTDMIAITADDFEKTVFGLRADGTVVAAGKNYTRYKLDSWENITAITAGNGIVYGLKDDGTVVAASTQSQSGWFSSAEKMTDIVAFDAVFGELVGIRSDGTAMAGSVYDQGYLYVEDWWGIRVPET